MSPPDQQSTDEELAQGAGAPDTVKAAHPHPDPAAAAAAAHKAHQHDQQATDDAMSAQAEPPAGSAPQGQGATVAEQQDERRQAPEDARERTDGLAQGPGTAAVGETDGEVDPKPADDWPPRETAIGKPEGLVRFGSTGQLFEVKDGQWARVSDPAAIDAALAAENQRRESHQRVSEQISSIEPPTEWAHDVHPLTLLQRLASDYAELKAKFDQLELKLRHMV